MLSLRDRLRPFAPDAAFFTAMLILIVTWLIAVPRWAVPDEPAHVFKAYGTAHGQGIGDAIPDSALASNYRHYSGPPTLGIGDLNCYFHHPDTPAGCDLPEGGYMVSSAARYPPYYYAVVGGAARLVGQDTSVRAYRFASALVCAAALAAAFGLIRRSKVRRSLPLMLVGLTPMALFMLGAVNPNALEIAGFVLVWALLARLCTDDHLSKRLTLATSVVAGIIVMSRPIATVWLVCIAVIVLIAVAAERRKEFFRIPYMVRLLVPLAISAIASVAWLKYSSFEVSDKNAATKVPLRTVLHMTYDLMSTYYRQAVGVLGWLDTDLPVVTYIGWTVALLAAAAVYLVRSHFRQWLALAALIAAWLALPFAINAFTASDAGVSFQGRYTLPILAGAGFLPMLDRRRSASGRAGDDGSALLIPIALVAITLAEVAGFWQMLRRFTVGANGKIWLFGDLPWEPGVAPMLLIALNAIVMIGLCVGVLAVSRRDVAADRVDGAAPGGIDDVVDPAVAEIS